MRIRKDPLESQIPWLTTAEVAELLRITPQCLRKWRCADKRAGRGWPEPGIGGLRWKKYGSCVRYDPSSVLVRTEPPAEDRV
jgi:hypothetical protein